MELVFFLKMIFNFYVIVLLILLLGNPSSYYLLQRGLHKIFCHRRQINEQTPNRGPETCGVISETMIKKV